MRRFFTIISIISLVVAQNSGEILFDFRADVHLGMFRKLVPQNPDRTFESYQDMCACLLTVMQLRINVHSEREKIGMESERLEAELDRVVHPRVTAKRA